MPSTITATCGADRGSGRSSKTTDAEATVYLRRHAVALPCLMEKWLTVRSDGTELRFRHRLTNLGTQPVPFTWNLHVAHAIAPDSRVYLPARAVAGVPGQSGRFDAAPGSLGWPVHDGTDMGALAGVDSGLTEWLYASELVAGWCAVTHPAVRRRPRALVRSRGLRDGVALGCLRRVAGPLCAAHRAEHGPAWRSRAGACRRHGRSARAGTDPRDDHGRDDPGKRRRLRPGGRAARGPVRTRGVAAPAVTTWR